FPLWEEEGRLNEGAGWLERALAAGRPAPDLLRAEGMRLLALLAVDLGDDTRAEALLRQCLRIYREHGNKVHVAAVLMALGLGARNRTDFGAARGHYEKSLAILTELGHTGEVARCLSWLGAAA